MNNGEADRDAGDGLPWYSLRGRTWWDVAYVILALAGIVMMALAVFAPRGPDSPMVVLFFAGLMVTAANVLRFIRRR